MDGGLCQRGRWQIVCVGVCTASPQSGHGKTRANYFRCGGCERLRFSTQVQRATKILVVLFHDRDALVMMETIEVQRESDEPCDNEFLSIL